MEVCMYQKFRDVCIDEEVFKKLYEDGYGEEGISRALNISVHASRKFIKKLGLVKHPFGRKDQKLREDTKRKISESHKGKILSPEHRYKVIKTLKYGQK